MANVSRRARKQKDVKQRAFLKAFAKCGVVTQAAEISGVSRLLHYQWMNTDPDYPEKFDDAAEQAADYLEQEAVRRAVAGVRRLKFYKGKPIIDPETGEPYVEHAYSDPLLLAMLKASRPEKFRERSEVETTGSVEVTNAGVRLEELSPELQKLVLRELRAKKEKP